MALRLKKIKAIELRKTGMSYSQIKERLKVSKSSLSLWLHEMPLSAAKIRELRADSAIRIERFRNTMFNKRAIRLNQLRKQIEKDIGILSHKEFLLAGLFLYWGEGGKTKPYTTSISNTDPVMIKFSLRWLQMLGARKEKIRVYLHLYRDMDPQVEIEYWAKVLDLPVSNFRKPYIKNSNRADINYTQKYTHGTCNLIYDDRDISEYVLEGLHVLRLQFAEGKTV